MSMDGAYPVVSYHGVIDVWKFVLRHCWRSSIAHWWYSSKYDNAYVELFRFHIYMSIGFWTGKAITRRYTRTTVTIQE
jgi:hypothetical protein